MKISTSHLTIAILAAVSISSSASWWITNEYGKDAISKLTQGTPVEPYTKYMHGTSDYQTYRSLRELSSAADSIFVGVHTGETVTIDGKMLYFAGSEPFKDTPTTFYTFRVTQVLKGSLQPGDSVSCRGTMAFRME